MTDRDLIRCPVCAVPWSEHTPICARHNFRPAAYRDPEPEPERTAGGIALPADAAANVTVSRFDLATVLDELERLRAASTGTPDPHVWIRRDEVAGMLRDVADGWVAHATRLGDKAAPWEAWQIAGYLRGFADKIEAGGRTERNGEVS